MNSSALTNENYKQLLETFHDYLLNIGYNKRTAKAKYYYLKTYLLWRENKGKMEVKSITTSEFQAYKKYVEQRGNKRDGSPLHPKTIFLYLETIKDMLVMLEAQGAIKTNPYSSFKITRPKEEKGARRFLSEQEISDLYAACKTYQERAILSLAYGCGLRVGELVGLNENDILLRERLVIVRKGKGSKRRIIPMSKGVVKDLQDYYYYERGNLMQGRDYSRGEQAFMLHKRGGRMQTNTYNKYLKKIIQNSDNEQLKSEQITMHQLRHSIATHLLKKGMKTEQLRRFLGHSQLESTQVYTHVSKEQVQNLK